MAFTYTAGSGSNRDRVRLLLGDTSVAKSTHQIFQDEEIDDLLAFVPESGDSTRQKVYRTAAAAARAIAASTARSAIAWRALERNVDRKQVPEHYRALAKEWEQQADGDDRVPDEYVANVAYDVDRFGKADTEFIGDDLF